MPRTRSIEAGRGRVAVIVDCLRVWEEQVESWRAGATVWDTLACRHRPCMKD